MFESVFRIEQYHLETVTTTCKIARNNDIGGVVSCPAFGNDGCRLNKIVLIREFHLCSMFERLKECRSSYR